MAPHPLRSSLLRPNIRLQNNFLREKFSPLRCGLLSKLFDHLCVMVLHALDYAGCLTRFCHTHVVLDCNRMVPAVVMHYYADFWPWLWVGLPKWTVTLVGLYYLSVYVCCTTNMLFADVDECQVRPGLCQHDCHNTDGGYRCSCYKGFNPDSSDHHQCIGQWPGLRQPFFVTSLIR